MSSNVCMRFPSALHASFQQCANSAADIAHLVTVKASLTGRNVGNSTETPGERSAPRDKRQIPTAPVDTMSSFRKRVKGRPVTKGVDDAMRPSWEELSCVLFRVWRLNADLIRIAEQVERVREALRRVVREIEDGAHVFVSTMI